MVAQGVSPGFARDKRIPSPVGAAEPIAYLVVDQWAAFLAPADGHKQIRFFSELVDGPRSVSESLARVARL